MIMSIICISKLRINWWTIVPRLWLVERAASYCSKKWPICAQIKDSWSLLKLRSKRSNSIMNLARLSMLGINSISKRWRSIRQPCSNNTFNSRSYNSSSKHWKIPQLLRFRSSNKWLLLPTKQQLQLLSQRIPLHWMTHSILLINISNNLNHKTPHRSPRLKKRR